MEDSVWILGNLQFAIFDLQSKYLFFSKSEIGNRKSKIQYFSYYGTDSDFLPSFSFFTGPSGYHPGNEKEKDKKETAMDVSLGIII